MTCIFIQLVALSPPAEMTQAFTMACTHRIAVLPSHNSGRCGVRFNFRVSRYSLRIRSTLFPTNTLAPPWSRRVAGRSVFQRRSAGQLPFFFGCADLRQATRPAVFPWGIKNRLTGKKNLIIPRVLTFVEFMAPLIIYLIDLIFLSGIRLIRFCFGGRTSCY